MDFFLPAERLLVELLPFCLVKVVVNGSLGRSVGCAVVLEVDGTGPSEEAERTLEELESPN